MEENTVDNTRPKGTFDPGWNDPPLFSYDTTKAVEVGGRKGQLLNKRVAFPLQPSKTTSSPSSSAGMPPLPPSIPDVAPPPVCSKAEAPPAPPVMSCELQASVAAGDNRAVLHEALPALYELLSSFPAEEQRAREDIRKRLDALKKMCEEDKLTPDMYKKIVQLTEALQAGDTLAAGHVQAAMAVDHVALCRPWIAGVRLLIHQVALCAASPAAAAGSG